MRTRTRAAAAVALLLSAALTASLTGCAGAADESSAPTATPEPSVPPVQAVDLAAGESDEPIEVDVDGGEEGVGVTFREITIAPGASTGVHCHYGQLVGVVHRGELTHYGEVHPGGVEVYREGDVIVEGPGYPHEGRNEGDRELVLWVTYIRPEGKPLAETDLANCD